MSYVWSEGELRKALGVMLQREIRSGKVEFNSKDINESDIFIVLQGEARDGHEFVQEAIERGAGLAIVAAHYANRNIAGDKLLHVPHTYEALLAMARYKRENLDAKFIGVTGSVGKTSSKEIIYRFLSHFDKSFCNRGNFNNHIGVPLSLASLPHDTKYSVNEIGMNNPGEIAPLANIARPHIALITNIGEGHLEQLGSMEAICREKCSIAEGLSTQGLSTGGTVIIHADSPFYERQKSLLQNYNVKNILSFGEADFADARLVSFDRRGDISHIEYEIHGKRFLTKTQLQGRHNAINIASALLVVDSLGHKFEELGDVIASLRPYEGRGLAHKLMINGHNVTIIDDSYNANPVSMKASLASMREASGYKIAVLSDMRELGPRSNELHKALLQDVLGANIEKLHSIGPAMKNLYDEIHGKIEAEHHNQADEQCFESIIAALPSMDSTILVKGSHSTKLYEFVTYILKKYGEGA